MDRQQIQFARDLYISSILEDFKALARQLLAEGNSLEGYRIQLQMAELVEIYESLGLLPAIEVYWPAGSKFIKLLNKTSELKGKIDELEHLKGS